MQNLVDLATLMTLKPLKLGNEQLFWSWKIKINLWEAGPVLVQINKRDATNPPWNNKRENNSKEEKSR